MIVNWRPERAAERAEAAEEVVRAAVHHADHGALVWAYLHRIRDAMQAGDVARADADLDRARPVAHATRRSFYRWFLMVAEAGRAAFAGPPGRGRVDDRGGAGAQPPATATTASRSTPSQRLVLARLRWRPHEADAAQLRGFAARYPHLPVWEAMLASLEWDLGNVEAARRSVRAVRARRLRRGRAAPPTSCPPRCAWPRRPPARASRAEVERLYELLLALRARRTRC